MQLEPTITYGNLITTVTFIGGGIGAWFALKQLVALLSLRVKMMENGIISIKQDIKDVEKDVSNIANILRDQAVMNQQIIHLQQQISEMKHGEGFVFPINRPATEVPPKR